MPLSPKPHDLARSLVDGESNATKASRQTEPATVRVYERLRRLLGAPFGSESFQILASRALMLARSESPQLKAVAFDENGNLRGLGELEAESDSEKSDEAGVILIAKLLSLSLTFLGEEATLRLIEDLRLQVEDTTEDAAAPGNAMELEAEAPILTAAFEDLLLEINRLRSVSEHIEFLAYKHPGMEDGLVSVAENIRSIATVLDVFTLIRSQAGGPEEEETVNLQSNPYMN